MEFSSKFRAFLTECLAVTKDKFHFSKWKWPAIPGRESFKGPILHSANWDESIQLAGKKVGVIGSGSSAVQIVPNIQPSEWSRDQGTPRIQGLIPDHSCIGLEVLHTEPVVGHCKLWSAICRKGGYEFQMWV